VTRLCLRTFSVHRVPAASFFPAHPECERRERIEGAIWPKRITAHRPLDTLAALATRGERFEKGTTETRWVEEVLRQSLVTGLCPPIQELTVAAEVGC
jgi:hypothetical protein